MTNKLICLDKWNKTKHRKRTERGQQRPRKLYPFSRYLQFYTPCSKTEWHNTFSSYFLNAKSDWNSRRSFFSVRFPILQPRKFKVNFVSHDYRSAKVFKIKRSVCYDLYHLWMSGYVIFNVVSYILLKTIGKSIAKGNIFTNEIQDAAERTPLFEKRINSKSKKIRKYVFYF